MSAFEEIAAEAQPIKLQPQTEINGPLRQLIDRADELAKKFAVADAAIAPMGALGGWESEAVDLLDALQEVRASPLPVARHDSTSAQWLDTSEPAHSTRRTAIYAMIRLSASSKRFPRSLYVRDIELGVVRDPSKMGGHADVFMARRAGRPVALKRLRTLDVRESDFYKARASLRRCSHLMTFLEESLS
jgi:hypothetical protein